MPTHLITLTLAFTLTPLHADWPQWRGPDRAGLWQTATLPTHLAPEHLTTVWSADAAPGYSGPTVLGDLVVIADRPGDAPDSWQERWRGLDRNDGTTRWTFSQPVDYSSLSYPAGPRASVTLHDGVGYALGAAGALHALDLASGEPRWSLDLVTDFDLALPVWGFASHPLLHNDLVIIQAGDTLAFHQDTGKLAWRSPGRRASYSSPVLHRSPDGAEAILIWAGEEFLVLDPTSGDRLAQLDLPPAKDWVSNIIEPLPGPTAPDGTTPLFLSSFFEGTRLLHLAHRDATWQLDLAWERVGASERRTEALHILMSPPIWPEASETIYGFDNYGHFRAISSRDGDRLWEATPMDEARNATAFPVRHPATGQLWIFTEQGDLIQATITPESYTELGRAHLIEPTTEVGGGRRYPVIWSHPAFAANSLFPRSDTQILRIDLKP
jgi:outer membrane protein assembly factor BamB